MASVKESLAVDSFSCLVKVATYLYLVKIISMFAWILLKRAAFCGNNFENVEIILRIIGEFKKNFWKE